jgi:hypothetical protein
MINGGGACEAGGARPALCRCQLTSFDVRDHVCHRHGSMMRQESLPYLSPLLL